MTGSEEYFEYLQQRSRLALLYRRLWLYPRLARHLTGRALDVGCGIGDLVRYRPDTIGVDVNPQLVAFCRSLGADVRYMERDSLPFASGSFQSAALDNVLEHLQNPAPLLAEIRRVLVPGGVLVVGVPGVLGYASDPDHKVFYDEAALRRCLTEAEFSARTLFHVPFASQWLSSRLRIYALYGVFSRD